MTTFGVTLRRCATCDTEAPARLLQIGVPQPLPGEQYSHIYRCRDQLLCRRRVAYNLETALR